MFKTLSLTLTLSLAISLWGSGCSSQSTPPESSASPRPETKSFLPFPVNEITEVTLGKWDYASGENWMATVKRGNLSTSPSAASTPSKKRPSSAQWKFTSIPDGKQTQDLLANSNFIVHLLDSFKNLRRIGDAPKGSLESFGLEPPHYVIRLTTQETSFELKVGNPSSQPQGTYLMAGSNPIFIGDGSALRMLDLISGFEYLRNRAWTEFSADDVDEVFLTRSGKPFFYAQREGDQWTDRNHHPILSQPTFKRALGTITVDSLLKNYAELNPQNLSDDLALLEKVQKRSLAQPFYEVRLVNRHGTESSLKLISFNLGSAVKNSPGNAPTLYGLSSSRPWVLFTLEPKLWDTLDRIYGQIGKKGN